MVQPPSFEVADLDLVCKLHKATYGLKQALCSWFTKLSTTLISFGFSSTKSDSSLFYKFTQSSILLVLIYVDDIHRNF